MNGSVTQRPGALRRLTPGNAVLFVTGRLGRLLLFQFAVALVVAGCVGWFFRTAWFPVITEAIAGLPERGEMRGGELTWSDVPPRLLAQNQFLGFGVDLQQRGRIRSTAHLYVEFGRRDVRFFSILGFTEVPYPAQYSIAMNRAELEPGWGAWKPILAGLLVLGTLVSLLLVWALLACLYAFPLWLIGFYANREVGFRAASRLAGAALIPGALLLAAAIICYGTGLFGLPELGAALVIHFAVGWVSVIVAPFLAEKVAPERQRSRNPFKS